MKPKQLTHYPKYAHLKYTPHSLEDYAPICGAGHTQGVMITTGETSLVTCTECTKALYTRSV